MLVYTIIEKSTGKLYDGKGDANEKCKKIQGFFSRFYSFSGTDVHSGFCECQSGGTEAELKEDYHLCRAHRKAESKQCQEESEMDFFEKADRSCFF